jgi:helicase
MKLSEIKKLIPAQLYCVLDSRITELRPAQSKAIKAGLLEKQNLLVCTPTASGKTLIAELAGIKCILEDSKKLVYIVPLKALASEKHKDFKKKYSPMLKVGLSIGDKDSSDSYLSKYDIIITTPEKLDSLIRHRTPWLEDVGLVVLDEIHLLNDPNRGPTLEILITILRQVLKNVQFLSLSATIGNPEELAEWLDAKVIKDNWRPVKLHKGVYLDGEIEFIKDKK